MSNESSFTIDRGSITALLSQTKEYKGKLYEALWIITDTVAKKMVVWARDNAIWENQTTNARQGLRGDAWWESSNQLVCSMSHTMEYGVWLELAHEKKYAILEKSINKYKDELIEGWKTLAGD